MTRLLGRVAAVSALGLLLLAPTSAEAQLSGSITGGLSNPTGVLGDLNDRGFTVQARGELSLLIAGVHAGVGYTRFAGKDIDIDEVSTKSDPLGVYNVGVGGRVGLGLVLWVGANGNYYFGDINGGDFGLVPEVGASLGPIEAIVDYKITGDLKWFSARVGFRF